MPELPEVETVRRGLAPAMEGAAIRQSRSARPPAALAAGQGLRKAPGRADGGGLGRRAKYLLADLSSGDVLIMHLGMSGSFRVGQDAKPGVYYHERSKSTAHDHVVFHMSNGATVTFNDPRRFGSMKLVPRAKLEHEPLLRALGPEPLGNEFDAAHAGARLRRQEDVAEGRAQRPARGGRPRQHLCLRGAVPRQALAEAPGLHHRRPQRQAERARRGAGRGDQGGAQDAIKAGGSSLRDHRRADGSLGDFQHNFQVYDREGEPCPDCKGKIKRIVQTGRSTFYCPSCQK